MEIEFTGKYAINQNFGINFQANVNGQNFTCVISTEALQDINQSSSISDDVEQQFLENRYSFEEIARRKIQAGEWVGNKVYINKKDI